MSSTTIDIFNLFAVLVLVLANGFFVAAEFSLVTVRRSRVSELVAQRRLNATALQRAVDHLDANLAATQLGITISSLALGWIGEPALAHLIEPLLTALPGDFIIAASHGIAVAIAFIIITALHIVLGELAPKSLALQRSEGTALWVVRPLALFLFIFRPAILFLNGLGSRILRLAGLEPGGDEGSLHSPEELKLLVAQSQQGGLLQPVQQEAVERILNVSERRGSARGRRDRALLLFGFVGALRRSELVALRVEDIDMVGNGLRLRPCSGPWMSRCARFHGRSLNRCILPNADVERGRAEPAIRYTRRAGGRSC